MDRRRLQNRPPREAQPGAGPALRASARTGDQHSRPRSGAGGLMITANRIEWPRGEKSTTLVLWLTAGLGCDGESISITAATQAALEELILGGLPWVPNIKLHNPFLA